MSDPNSDAGAAPDAAKALSAILGKMRGEAGGSAPAPDAPPGAPAPEKKRRGRPPGSGRKSPSGGEGDAALMFLRSPVGAEACAQIYGLPFTVTAAVLRIPDGVLEHAVPEDRLHRGGAALRAVLEIYAPQFAKHIPLVALAGCYAVDGVAFYRTMGEWKAAQARAEAERANMRAVPKSATEEARSDAAKVAASDAIPDTAGAQEDAGNRSPE